MQPMSQQAEENLAGPLRNKGNMIQAVDSDKDLADEHTRIQWASLESPLPAAAETVRPHGLVWELKNLSSLVRFKS